MCSISGFISYKDKKEVVKRLDEMFFSANERGRDSFGYVASMGHGFIEFRKLGRFENNQKHMIGNVVRNDEAVSIIANHRAEPTTEYVPNKRLFDVQPFVVGDIAVAHNGTISNDKELAKEFGVELEGGEIDTLVLAMVLEKLNTNDLNEIAKFIHTRVKGSYAMAVLIDTKVLLINNYKPIYLNFTDEGMYFASQPKYVAFNFNEPIKDNIKKMPTYSYIVLDCKEFTKGSNLNFVSFAKEPNKKALVVCSGGLDSTTALKVAIDRFGKENVTLLHFKYHCNAEEKEVEAVRNISQRLGVEVVFMPIDIFGDVITESPILTGEGQVQEYDKGVEFAYEWVPARNLVMMSLATALAEAKGYGYIYLGNNLEESGAYPDNEMEFIEGLRRLMPNCVADGYSLEIEQPVGNLMKHEIVSLGLEINAPLDLTWSCYKTGEKHCGVCGPCRMRKVAFEMAGKEEVISYLK